MKKLLGFLYLMVLYFMMAGPAFAWFDFWDWFPCFPSSPTHNVPEPSTMLLLGSGAFILGALGRKKIKK